MKQNITFSPRTYAYRDQDQRNGLSADWQVLGCPKALRGCDIFRDNSLTFLSVYYAL